MKLGLTARQILSLMVFWGQIQNYSMRKNLSLLIVAMVKDEPSTSVTVSNTSTETCMENKYGELAYKKPTKESNEDGFEWDAFLRGQVLGSFFFGYISTQIIGGRLCEYYGVKKVYGFGIFFTGILTLLSPVVAHWNVYAFMALRVLQGMFEGVSFPSLQAMTARWIPVKERSSFIARSYFSTCIGMVLTYTLSGVLAANYGWECPFYVIGGVTVAWFICWWGLVFDTPDKHPRIDPEELAHIKDELADTVAEKPLPVPWRAILTSIPFWSMVISDIGNSFGHSMMGSQGPSYLKYILGLDIKTNGFLSALPMLCRYISGVTFGYVADLCLTKKLMSVLWVRRTFNTIGQVGPSIAMMMLAFPPNGIECNVWYVEVVICVGFFLNGPFCAGHWGSPGDLAPNYAGTMFGISNTLTGGSLGFIVPVWIGYMTKDNQSFGAWTIIFTTASAFYFVTNLVYCAFISGEVQAWNYKHVRLSK